ncbi:hypothetical protein PGT21_031403 [Puccinia graminis f. sp. tritici]|uniref:Uncharacterized protein n=1 Tax=Puccinia graminis f. sp. tritici TaxID=56615 RepID=A0A5B0PVK6_PUCGR|nr:hypothetical protein PGTUg99_005043 [Puccinia graminis f. sp. tritici]KAA1104768.1 hypothetical protein PGT21_031403 [Puccinia graminis f. sp. tritici]
MPVGSMDCLSSHASSLVHAISLQQSRSGMPQSVIRKRKFNRQPILSVYRPLMASEQRQTTVALWG